MGLNDWNRLADGPTNALGFAVWVLGSAGIAVRRVEEPWLDLYDVQGRGELTRSQVIHLARQIGFGQSGALGPPRTDAPGEQF